MFKGLANFGALLKQAQQIGGQMGQITEEMRKRRVIGTAGGGMVEIEVNGLMEVLHCRIDPNWSPERSRVDGRSGHGGRQPSHRQGQADACRGDSQHLTGGLRCPAVSARPWKSSAERKREEGEEQGISGQLVSGQWPDAD